MVKHIRTLKAFWYLVLKRNKDLATLQLDVTADCNLRCKTCYFFKDDQGHHMSKDMPLERVEALFREYRGKKVHAVWLFGGEPTCGPT
jgi:sulfatase maturation enzyme AslB (radical SAM superfamily)